MSKWNSNESRIDVPYHINNKYICVEHPATIVNVDNAIKTLGGIENVSQVYSDSSKRLPLCWRPDDIYCKPACADRMAVNNLLMKVTRRTRKRDGHVEYSVSFEGSIETSYKFQCLCDFQYLPMKTQPDGTHVSIYEDLCTSLKCDRQTYFNRDVPLFIPPIIFSRVDKPTDFLYRQDIEHRGQYKNPDVNRPANLIGTVRQKRSVYTIFVNFGEPIPMKPIDEAVKKLSAEFVDPEGEKVIRKLFEEKPLWLKVELEHRTNYRSDKLKIFLPAVCFYWLDGPWRAQWNKFGFDPTKNVSAKIYQTVDFRIRQVRPGQMQVKAKRSDLKMNQFNMTSRNQKHNVKISLKALGEENPGIRPDTSAQEDKEVLFKFKPNKVPPQRMMYYPAMYVLIDEVQEMLHQNDGQEKECTERDGWCVKGFNMMARDYMYQYMNRLLYLDDSVEYKFWRTKKKKRTLKLLNLDDDPEKTFTDTITENVASKTDSVPAGADNVAAGTDNVAAGADGGTENVADLDAASENTNTEADEAGKVMDSETSTLDVQHSETGQSQETAVDSGDKTEPGQGVVAETGKMEVNTDALDDGAERSEVMDTGD